MNSNFIVKFFGKLEDEENIYLILELINGLDLFHTMRQKRLKLSEITNLTRKIVLCLEYIHSQGIVYRDLKPENIMIDEDGNPKIIDFGLSKCINDERTATVCGSPEYMAPEVIRKRPYNYSVDFWALGILIYELFCGYNLNRHPPFQGESYMEICQNISRGALEFTRSVDPISKDLIRRLLNTEPAYRLGCLKNKILDIKNHKFFRDSQ